MAAVCLTERSAAGVETGRRAVAESANVAAAESANAAATRERAGVAAAIEGGVAAENAAAVTVVREEGATETSTSSQFNNRNSATVC